MQPFIRQNPRFSLCGLNCALCPMNVGHYCPGCGGGAGNQPCAIARCANQRPGVEYCYQCDQFPCEKYPEIDRADSFITYRNRSRDLEKHRRIGESAYETELNEKSSILAVLLDRFNDGRRKSFFCLAVNLLELEDLRSIMRELDTVDRPLDWTVKERAQVAVRKMKAAADKRGIALILRKAPGKDERE